MRKLFILIIFLFCFTFPSGTFAATTFDMATTTNWNIRIDGCGLTDYLSHPIMQSADLDNDGKNDLIIPSYIADNNSRINSGSVYIIFNSLLQTFTKGSTIDLCNAGNFSMRIDGAKAGDAIGDGVFLGDLDNDGKQDLLFGYYNATQNSRSNSGAIWIVLNKLLMQKYQGIGTVIDLLETSNYNIRLDGAVAGDGFGDVYSTIADFDNDGKNDLALAAFKTDYSAVDAGSVYIITNNILSTFYSDASYTGNNIDMANTNNFDLRIDGAGTNDWFGHLSLVSAQIDNVGGADLLVGAQNTDYNSRNNSGSAYYFTDTQIRYLISQGKTSSVSNPIYNLRIDGSSANEYAFVTGVSASDINNDGFVEVILGSLLYNSNTGAVWVVNNTKFLNHASSLGSILDLVGAQAYNFSFQGANSGDVLGYLKNSNFFDFNSDGRPDILLTARKTDNNSRTDSGSLYILNNYIFANYLQSNAQNITLTNTDNYSLRFDGAGAGDWLSYPTSSIATDLNNDGSYDLVMGSNTADFNSRTDSGSVYIIYNFPHTISFGQTSKASIVGSVSAPNSVTSVSGVQYSIDDNSPSSSSWKDCSGTTSFTCLPNITDDWDHAVYIRAYDTNGSYTAQVSYAKVKFGKPVSSISPNCSLPFYKHCVTSGPNFKGNEPLISSANAGYGFAQALIPSISHHDDTYVEIKQEKPAKRLNYPLMGEVFHYSAVSSFNGYPVTQFDHPVTIILPYDKTKLGTNNPNNLRITKLNQMTNQWEILTNNTVLDTQRNTIANTTNSFSYFAPVLYLQPQYQSQQTSVLGVQTEETKQEEVKQQPKSPARNASRSETGRCFLWWCW